MTPAPAEPSSSAVRFRVVGMDCASDAAQVERAARAAGAGEARVSTAKQTLTLHSVEVDVDAVEAAVAEAGFRLERADGDGAAGVVSPAYRRAMWVVIVLNVGYGVVEMVGGFLSDSQALKADALDFLGDGLITFLGILAAGWSLAWRARSALIQGLFLGVLGLGVIGDTAYRLLAGGEPAAAGMGLFGGVALAVNVVAALVLIPHRAGDSNVRAVWLFSRNDALGNLAVVAAAGVIALTGWAWPDLAVAVVIAGLFLHSSWSIVRDARSDLRRAD